MVILGFIGAVLLILAVLGMVGILIKIAIENFRPSKKQTNIKIEFHVKHPDSEA